MTGEVIRPDVRAFGTVKLARSIHNPAFGSLAQDQARKKRSLELI